MSDTKYYYSDANNKPVGPVTVEQLRQLAQDGVINNYTNVIVEGTSNWVPYGDIVASQQGNEVAARIAQQARNMGAALGQFNWGAFFFGLLLVLIQGFILPYNLLKQAAATLSAWGKSKVLPTGQSDLPVLTFLTVVIRPAVHILFTACAFLFATVFAYEASGMGERLGIFIGLLILIYFANFYVGLVFDAVSCIVGIANGVKSIERRK